jgi:hypothetical protein
MFEFDSAIERRIVAAQKHSDFDDLPGAGRPLELDDDSMVPRNLRMAYRILKNAGYAPQAVTLRALIGEAVAESEQANTTTARRRAQKKVAMLLTRLESSSSALLAVIDSYRSALAKRLQSVEESPPPSRLPDGYRGLEGN